MLGHLVKDFNNEKWKDNKFKEFIDEKLKIKLAKLAKDDKYSQLDENDVEGTPNELYEKIYRRIGIGKQFLMDPCPYYELWNYEDCYSSLTSDFIGDLIYLNHPFSKTAAYLVKVMQ